MQSTNVIVSTTTNDNTFKTYNHDGFFKEMETTKEKIGGFSMEKDPSNEKSLSLPASPVRDVLINESQPEVVVNRK